MHDDLRHRIVTGEYHAGDALPTEDQLCNRYGVSKITTRRALQELALEGHVERRHGVGTIVLDAPANQFTFVGEVDSLLENFAFQSLSQHYEILEYRHRVFPEEVCEVLEIAPGSRGLHTVSVAIRDGERAYHTNTFIPDPVARGLTRALLGRTASIVLLMQRGVRIGAADQRLQAVPPPSAVQRALRIREGHPTLRARLTIFDHVGAAVQHVDSFIRGELYEYRSLMAQAGRHSVFPGRKR